MERPRAWNYDVSDIHIDIHRVCTKALATGHAYHGPPGIEANEWTLPAAVAA
jgi:hypothetical protein